MAEPDFPDIYADGVSVAAGPYGLTMTFLLTDPLDPNPDPKLPGRIVGRLRVGPLLAEAMASIVQRSLQNMPAPRLTFGEEPPETESSSDEERDQ